MMTSCDCIFDSQYAYVINKNSDNLINNNLITIVEYDNNKDNIQEKVNNKKKILVCYNKNELIFVKQSDKQRAYFRHNNCIHEDMSEWHKNWQNNFEYIEQRIGNRYADALINNIVLEFQHSKISNILITPKTRKMRKCTEK